MNDLEKSVLSILKEFGGEASMFLITNPDTPWGKLGDAGALEGAVKSLAGQGMVTHDAGADVVAMTDQGNAAV